MQTHLGSSAELLVGATPLIRKALHTQMKDHARCLSLPQLTDSIHNLGGGTLPKAESVIRTVLLAVYAERNGTPAADDLLDQLGLSRPYVLEA